MEGTSTAIAQVGCKVKVRSGPTLIILIEANDGDSTTYTSALLLVRWKVEKHCAVERTFRDASLEANTLVRISCTSIEDEGAILIRFDFNTGASGPEGIAILGSVDIEEDRATHLFKIPRALIGESSSGKGASVGDVDGVTREIFGYRSKATAGFRALGTYRAASRPGSNLNIYLKFGSTVESH